MTTRTKNARRAMRLGHILTWCKDWSNPREGLIELLTDAMHWCRRNGQDFDYLLEIAAEFYESDIIEDYGVLP
jgi:hypothetical protein